MASNNTVTEAVEFLVGDILVDTKFSYGGHVMVVFRVDPLRDRVVITHPGFTFPATLKWNKYSAFQNKTPKEGKAKYILRWIGPSHAVDKNGNMTSIREKLVEVISRLHYFSRRGHDLDYSRYKGACMYMKDACFTSNRKISLQTLEQIQKTESFVCSSYAVFVWKYVLEQFLIPDNLRNNALQDASTLDDIAFPINPYECLPKDILQIAKRYPTYWEKVPYYTKKTEFIEMDELSNKRIIHSPNNASVLPASPAPSAPSAPSGPSAYMNLSSMPYLFGGNYSKCSRRQMKGRKNRRTIKNRRNTRYK